MTSAGVAVPGSGTLAVVALLTGEEIDGALAKLSRWERDGDAIVSDRKLEDFAAAIEFVDRVAELAEAANHHPDLLVHGWNNVRLTLSTHSEGGLTEADFRLAGQIEVIA
jgi:4a-hydroxytetrahydrobiopterin dehydratase